MPRPNSSTATASSAATAAAITGPPTLISRTTTGSPTALVAARSTNALEGRIDVGTSLSPRQPRGPPGASAPRACRAASPPNLRTRWA